MSRGGDAVLSLRPWPASQTLRPSRRKGDSASLVFESVGDLSEPWGACCIGGDKYIKYKPSKRDKRGRVVWCATAAVNQF